MHVCLVTVVAMYLHAILVLKQVTQIIIYSYYVVGKMIGGGGGRVVATPATAPVDQPLTSLTTVG